MSSSYIIDITHSIEVPEKSKRMLDLLSKGLVRVKEKDSQIIELGVVGGAIVDLLLGITPRDLDIRYSYQTEGELSKLCCCEHIHSLINKEFDPELLEYEIDLENILEMEPWLDLKEKHLGLLSQHTDYISMFILDSNGSIWGNKDSLRYLQERVFETRFEGWLMWLAFRDIDNYYRILCGATTRGLSYVDRKNLKVGEKFKLALEYLPFALEQLVKLPKEQVSYRRLFKSKIGDIRKFRDILEKQNVEQKEKICELVDQILTS